MPWKTTKFKFFGVAIRRRNLFRLTMVFAVALAPTASLALIAQNANIVQQEKIVYVVATVIFAIGTFKGWWMITRMNPILYRDEARRLLFSAVVLLAAAVSLGCFVAHRYIKPNGLAYLTPLVPGGAFMIFLIARLCMLGSLPKRGDIVRGESGPKRKKKTSTGQTPLPIAAAADSAAEDELEEEEELDEETAGTDNGHS